MRPRGTGGHGSSRARGPWATNILLNSWSFTDPTNWVSDRGYPPVSATNLGISDLGAGTALVVDSTEPAWLQYNVMENDGATNLVVHHGSVMFWFAPNWAGTNAGGTGPGEWSRLIEAGSYTEDASCGWWSFYVDPDGVNLYFAAQTNDGSQAVYLSAPIEWTTNKWHLLALTYSSTNSALYVDGEWVTNGLPVTYWPSPDALANGFYIGSASNGTAQAHGMFDSLSTYANPLDAGSVASTFWRNNAAYYLNPMNIANISSAPSTPQLAPTFVAITGPGYLTNGFALTNCQPNSNVWTTNVVVTNVIGALVTNGTVNVTFSIVGGSNGAPYDVFATSALKYLITNAVWAWMGQGYSCTRHTISNLPITGAWLILGTPQDRDGDGLTDAFELLVNHTNPDTNDSSGDGLLDGWKFLWGLNSQTNNVAQPAHRANYTYDPAGWLKQVTDIPSEAFGPDAEGNMFNSGN